EKARVLAHTTFWNTLKKICVIHVRPSSACRAIADLIHSAPDVTIFPNVIPSNVLEILNEPEKANEFVDHLAESVGETITSHCSIEIEYSHEDQFRLFEILMAMGFRIIVLSSDSIIEDWLSLNSENLTEIDINRLEEKLRSREKTRREFLKKFSECASKMGLQTGEVAQETSTSTALIDPLSAIHNIQSFLDFDIAIPSANGTGLPDPALIDRARLQLRARKLK
ncbi:MAG: hypothetical protein MI807_22220, partial [Verrucomicrobiales bacterium]|nr:hypothetical protein [Verrucomicrobiales bacterium]